MPSSARPYPPSFFDRYFDWVERQPLPLWLYYPLLFALTSLVYHALAWYAGELPVGQLDIFYVVEGIWWPLESGTMHYLDHVGRKRLEAMRGILADEPDSFETLHYKIQTMPARTVLFLSGLLLLGTIIFTTVDIANGVAPLLAILGGLVFFASYITSPAYLYHAVHQLGVVRRAYAQVQEINLFNLGPLHSLSVLTAQTGIAIFILMGLNYVNNFALTGGTDNPLFAFVLPVIFVGLALTVFLVPLLQIRERVQSKKEAALEENGALLQGAVSDLQAGIAANNRKGSGELEGNIGALLTVREQLKRISPWPWNPETLRGFLSATLLPIALFIVQQILSRFL